MIPSAGQVGLETKKRIIDFFDQFTAFISRYFGAI
jgi:hypothetical protein